MPTVIDLTFNNTGRSKLYSCNYSSAGDTKGVFYVIGSSFGLANYITPNTASNLPVAAIDRSTATTAVTLNSQGLDFTLTDHTLYPEYLTVFGDAGTYTLKGITNGISYVLGTQTSTGSGWVSIPLSSDVYYDSFNLSTSASGINIAELELYGLLRRKDDNYLGSFPRVTTLESFYDARLGTGQKGYLSYANTLTVKNDVIYPSFEMTLTGDLDINSFGDSYLHYYLNPGGANRIIKLPTVPSPHQYLRVTSLDGNYLLTIKDGDSNTVVELSNLQGTLSAEHIWDNINSTWHVTA